MVLESDSLLLLGCGIKLQGQISFLFKLLSICLFLTDLRTLYERY